MRLPLIAALAALTACTQTTANQTSAANDVPPNYRALAAAKLRETLKDPYSVRDASISEPTSGFVGLLNGGSASMVCVRLNSKNSFGAYTGISEMAVIFRGGVATDAMNDELNCARRSYSPFPEIMAAR